MPFVRSHDGVRLHYSSRGDARPDPRPALLIHGAAASSAIWMMVAARLAPHTRVVAIDLPGHGPSDPLPGPATLTAYRDAVGELGAALALGPSVLVGHSMGALIAVMAAAAWPDKVAGLVLVGAAPHLPVTDDILAAIDEGDRGFLAFLADRGLSPAISPALRRAFLGAGVAVPAEVARADFAACRDVDVGGTLATLRVAPVWVDGADDRMVPAEARRGRPGEVVELPSVGHMIPIEAPQAIADATRRVLGV